MTEKHDADCNDYCPHFPPKERHHNVLVESLAKDILTEIDGGEECIGHDQQLSEWAERVRRLRI